MISKLSGLANFWRAFRALGTDFHPTFYRSQSPNFERMSDTRLRVHYCLSGWQAGLDPSPNFSTQHYLSAYDDVVRSGLNPFYHYLSSGQYEDRDTRPALVWKAEVDILLPHFSPTYYRAVHPELASYSDRMLASHYHAEGWKRGYDPHPNFSTAFYLKTHADIRLQRIDPFLHYIRIGQAEGRATCPGLPQDWEGLSEEQIARLLEFFDADFYKSFVPDLQGDKLDLLHHYVSKGWSMGYDPGPRFSNVYYQETYSDVWGICPLVHFVLQLHSEGRRGTWDAPLRLSFHPDTVTLPHLDFPLPEDVLPDPPATPSARASAGGLDLHWVIPDFTKGGGGHMTIFRIIRHLENFGHRCTIWVDNPSQHFLPEAAYEDIIKYFQCIEAQVRFVHDGFDRASGDAVIATAWTTAYVVQAAQGFAEKFYFVQDYEPDFYPAGTERYMASRTYEFDLACICASFWLEKRMRNDHGRWSRSFYLAYDHRVYGVHKIQSGAERRMTVANGRKKIAVYAREHTARRCVHLAILALSRLSRKRTNFEVHFFGQNRLSFSETSFISFNHGVLDDERLALLYNECDLGLCFSATNYSLVPQEMMACGLPLVELDGEITRAIFPEGVVTLAEPEPCDICDQISALLDDPERCAKQRAMAQEWIEAFTWEGAAREIEAAVTEYLEEHGTRLPAPTVMRTRELLLDVVIPTYNGMGELEPVIKALRDQHLWENMQVYCIDSSSNDGTTEWLRNQPDLSLTVIDQRDFQHGRTRNQGASLGQAPLISFLTQDAVPVGSAWAGDIVRMMRHYSQAAGLFGRHLPYPEHPLYVRQEIERHFDKMLQYPLAVSRDTDQERWDSGDQAWRQFLHFYSDNNSALRRAIWQEIPYPEVDYGEDQLWARDIIEAGYTKLYAPTVKVYHSHDYSPEETYKRCYIEAAFFYENFNYKMGCIAGHNLEAWLRSQDEAIAHRGRKYQMPEAEIRRQQQIQAQKYRGWHDGLLAAKRRVALGKTRA